MNDKIDDSKQKISTTTTKKRRVMTGRTLSIRDKNNNELQTLERNGTYSHEWLKTCLNRFFEKQGLPYHVSIEPSKFTGEWRMQTTTKVSTWNDQTK